MMATTAKSSASSLPESLDFQWADYQWQCIEDLEAGRYDVVCLRTGYGGGKSYAGAQWIHQGSLQLDHGESLVLAPDFQKGGPATYRVFFETLPGANTVPNDAGGDPENSPIVAGYNQNQKRVTYISGHVVRLGSADKWNRYAGSEFHRQWWDEPAHYDNTDLYDLHEMLVSRQRTQAGPNTTFWTSTGAGYDQFYDITERHVDADEDPLSWADSLKVYTESSLKNPFLTEDAKEKLRRQFGGTERAEQALHGGFAAPQGLVYGQFTRNTHVRRSTDLEDELEGEFAIYGYDAGWNDPRVLLDIRRTHSGQYVVWDEYYESESRLPDLVDPDNVLEGRRAWIEGRPRGVVYCEHEPAHIQAFRKAGWPAKKAEKSLDGGIDHVRDRLTTDQEGRPGLLVTERCTDLIQEFLSYKEEHVGKSGAKDHALDALRYALFTHRPRKTKDGDSGDSSGISYL